VKERKDKMKIHFDSTNTLNDIRNIKEFLNRIKSLTIEELESMDNEEFQIEIEEFKTLGNLDEFLADNFGYKYVGTLEYDGYKEDDLNDIYYLQTKLDYPKLAIINTEWGWKVAIADYYTDEWIH
jgi:hypothetical protein